MGNSFGTTAASGGGGNPAGYYASKSDIENEFGIENVRKWSQLDNAVTTADDTRILASLIKSDKVIDNKLRGGRYTVPLVGFDQSVTTWAAVLAGADLYSARGSYEEDAEGNRFDGKVKAVMAEIELARSGGIRLTAEDARSPMPECAQVV